MSELCNQQLRVMQVNPDMDNLSLTETDQNTSLQTKDTMMAPTTSAPIPIPGSASKMGQVSNKSDLTYHSDSTSSPPSVPSNSPADEPQPTKNPVKAKINTKRSIKRIDHINNRTHSGYVYQIPPPISGVKTQETEPPASVMRRKKWREEVASWRVLQDIGLREWEWSCGELTTTTTVDTKNSDRGPYAERVRSFTYTRASTLR